ncbi:hypothetical protein BHM03_00062446 [Ensete ventricosum]|nr:hypothetical protein BHM03_00062446 [Ensete ventricosum]
MSYEHGFTKKQTLREVACRVEFRSVLCAPSRKFKILAILDVLAHGKSYEHGFTKKCDGHELYAESSFDRFFVHRLRKTGRFLNSLIMVHGVFPTLHPLTCYYFGRLLGLFQSRTTLQICLFGFMIMINLVLHLHVTKLDDETSGSQVVGHGIVHAHSDIPYVQGRPFSANFLRWTICSEEVFIL